MGGGVGGAFGSNARASSGTGEPPGREWGMRGPLSGAIGEHGIRDDISMI